jgi:hypothetical protein
MAPATATQGGREGKKKNVSMSVKAGVQFPAARINRFLRTGRYSKWVGKGAGIYMAAVLEVGRGGFECRSTAD